LPFLGEIDPAMIAAIGDRFIAFRRTLRGFSSHSSLMPR